MLEVKIYRHKEYKEIMLYWSCGELKSTRNLIRAIEGYQRIHEQLWSPGKLIYTDLTLEAEVDGYTGTLTKRVELKFEDFEVVTLREVE